jgi:rSAM/selenodomain-associated transferase 2
VAVIAGVAAVGLCAFTGAFLATRETPDALVAVHAAIFALSLVVWVAALQAPRPAQGTLLIGLAILARLALLPFPPSDDVSRYLWEGRLVLAGESPYARPAADAPAAWQDDAWAAMNNKDKLTAYPPLAQAAFAAAVMLGGTLPLKLLLIAAEIATLMLLLGELRRRELPEAHLALVALNPVLLLGTAGEAHFDALFVLAMLLAVLARSRDRPVLAWVALAAAVGLKVVPILLVPMFLRRGGWRSAPVFAIALALPLLPFLDHLPNLLLGLVSFGGSGYHNGFLPHLLRDLGAGTESAAAAAFAVLGLWSALVTWRVADPWRGAFLLLAGLLLVTPITHYWYFGWLVPFLVIQPQPAWLLMSGLQAFYFASWGQALATGAWAQPAWAWLAQWPPFIVLLALTAWPSACRLFAWHRPFELRWSFEQRWPDPATVTAIIPVYDEARRIAACIADLRRQGAALSEIIVVDGGSTDGTAASARAAGAIVIEGPRGRGRQVAAGVAEATGDVIWIVHADFSPAPRTAAAILAALAAEPAAAGGAVGQRFTGAGPLLLAVEWLNAVRSAMFGLSFGDQGQFVRRDALAGIGGFPALPLMEDVELSLRLRRAGPVLHLGRNGVVSSRRWETVHPARRIATVLRFTASYLVSRRRYALSEELFRRYYPVKRK